MRWISRQAMIFSFEFNLSKLQAELMTEALLGMINSGKRLAVSTDDEGDFASLPEKVSVDKINERVIFFKPSKETLAESLEIKILPF